MNRKDEDMENILIERIREGDERAFNVLFKSCGVRLYQFSSRYLHNKEDVEDLLHDVFLKIWQNRKSLKTGTSFRSYLFTIAYNNIRQLFLNRSREERYIRRFADEYLHNPADEDQTDYTALITKSQQAIALLPAKRKEIFLLRYKEELKNKEIAAKLGLSEQFVKNQLSIARKFLIRKFKESTAMADMLLFFLFKRIKNKY